MWRTKVIFLLIFVMYCTLKAQDKKLNNIYMELGGNAIVLSINYERVIIDNISIRIGLGTFFGSFKINSPLPILVNYRLYINGYHIEGNYIEVGLGASYFFSSADFSRLSSSMFKALIPTGVIAYCANAGEHINWRIAFTPFFTGNGILPFAGLSLGYSF